MIILGVETSCDETAIAIIEVKDNKIQVLSNVVSSQVKLHAKYGGVVPNLAAREHEKNLPRVFTLALKKSKLKITDIDLMAVTRGPGLSPSLWRGINFAKEISEKYKKPLIGMNHLEGHIYSNWLKPIRVACNLQPTTYNFPILNLIVSGGHTELVLMEDHGKYKVVGETLDDAVGEAFDKVARLLGLGYPGGPAISQRAEKWKSRISNSKSQIKHKSQILNIEFPRPMINSKNYNFSYAGLKTSVLYKIRDLKAAGVKITDEVKNEVCYEFQKAALDILVLKTIKAAQELKVKSLFLSGGVSANKELRERLEAEAKNLKIKYSQPEFKYTGDNAAMITVAGYFNYKNNPALSKKGGASKTAPNWQSVEMDANLGF